MNLYFSVMRRLEIDAGELTPYVLLDKEQGIFKIEGFSFPENSYSFYIEIVNWFTEYAKNPNEETTVSFGFLYVNSTSVKFIHEIIKRLGGLIAEGKKASVIWYIREHDEDIEQLGMELKGLNNVPFTIVPKEEEKPGEQKKFF